MPGSKPVGSPDWNCAVDKPVMPPSLLMLPAPCLRPLVCLSQYEELMSPFMVSLRINPPTNWVFFEADTAPMEYDDVIDEGPMFVVSPTRPPILSMPAVA